MTRVTHANPLSGLLLKEAAYLAQSNGGKPNSEHRALTYVERSVLEGGHL